MINKFSKILLLLFFFNSYNLLFANEQFEFNVKEIQVTNEGNLFKGLKRGSAYTNKNNTIITADIFEYNKITNILKATGNVKIEDKIKNYIINSDYIIYNKNKEEIFSKGETKANIESKYQISSYDIFLDRKKNILKSNHKSIILDNQFTQYETDTLNYSIDSNVFKGSNIKISTNINESNEEKELYFFSDGIFNLKKKDFVARDTKIYIKKNIFNKTDNDPRIYGKSSKKIGNITKINKGVFTSCKLTDTCPPWSIQAKSIVHDKEKEDIIYNHPILKVYDFPIIYFPKFSHPDPSVIRRSGFLQPLFNNSNVLGSSLFLPYFKVLSDNKDITFKPTFFDSKIYMFQTEYRQKNENSNLISNFGLTKGYQTNNEPREHIGNLFTKFTSKLKLDNFINSDLDFTIQKTTKDTFLKVFDTNLIGVSNQIKPDPNKLSSEINLRLEHENYNFSTGIMAYENLSGLNSDRYQYILPYYNFSKNFYKNSLLNFNFSSSGSNNLRETNKLKTAVNNQLDIKTKDFFSNFGFQNKFNILFMNLNTYGKNETNYKSKPQIELMNLINLETTLPLIKYEDYHTKIFTPKISFRINPGDMNNSINDSSSINVNNIFDLQRLNLNDTLEAGKSLTLGIDYKKETIEDINRYFELKFAGVIRDVEQKEIPLSSSLNQKTSNLFGSSKYSLSKNFNLNYDFSIDNDLNTFEQNLVKLDFNFEKFSTDFSFIENNGKMGDANIFQNSTTINLDKNNFLTFGTRRNRKINFTEYYDLIYQYKNDCLEAGIKYKKSYYADRDLKPSENLLFTITFFPISQFEQKINPSLYRGD